MLDPEPGAGAAVVAGRPAAVLQAVGVQGVPPVLPEEVPVQPGGNVVPGQRLVLGPVAVDRFLQGETVGGEGIGPQIQVEVLSPLLEGAARSPDLLDDGADPAIAPAGDSLGRSGLGVVPADGQPPDPPRRLAAEG